MNSTEVFVFLILISVLLFILLRRLIRPKSFNRNHDSLKNETIPPSIPDYKIDDSQSTKERIDEIIEIIVYVRSKITDDSYMDWTSFDTAEELRNKLDRLITELKLGNKEALEKFNLYFGPTGTFQELSISNGWSDEYMKISARFDSLYDKITGRLP